MRLFNRTPRTEPVSEHFSMSEFASRGEPVPRKYWKNLQKLMDNLEALRAYLGGTPIRITSGWRSPKHNKSVGGARFSKHKKAMAADIKTSKYTPRQVSNAIDNLTAMGRMHNGGLGRYARFTHYDVRARRARWRG